MGDDVILNLHGNKSWEILGLFPKLKKNWTTKNLFSKNQNYTYFWCNSFLNTSEYYTSMAS